MNLYILQQYKFIQQLFKHSSLLDVLVNIEDFLDLLGLYSYENWEKGQIVGTEFKKYFANLILKYPYKDMPNPKAKKLLEKYNCIVSFKEADDYFPIKKIENSDETFIDDRTEQRRNKTKKEKVWIVDILIPRKYIENDTLYDLDSIQQILDDEEEE